MIPLADRIADAIEHEEGFCVTKAEARARGIRFPTLAQEQANPGNVRRWSDLHPVRRGYLDFALWAKQQGKPPEAALPEGRRVLRALVAQYLRGKYTGSKVPTLYQMFAVYAPSKDKNNPKAYAEHVSARIGVPPDVQLLPDLPEAA